MTTAGMIFMIVSLAFVWGLTFWCFKKVLTAPAPFCTTLPWMLE